MLTGLSQTMCIRRSTSNYNMEPTPCVQSKMPQSSKMAVDEDDTDIERRALLRRRQTAKVRA